MAREGEKKVSEKEFICVTCKFFGPKNKKGTLEEISKLEDGVCKFYPPKDTEELDAYPRVSKSNWCNKYEQRPSREVKVIVCGERVSFQKPGRVKINGF